MISRIIITLMVSITDIIAAIAAVAGYSITVSFGFFSSP
jgi:hypothetical protein